MARPRQVLLSRQRIIDSAVALVDAEGLAALSTRRLASQLGVQGPSLYYHFSNKEEILDAVADVIAAHVDVSFFGKHDWRMALRLWGHSYRDALASHPNIVPVIAQGPRRRPAELTMANAVFDGLARVYENVVGPLPPLPTSEPPEDAVTAEMLGHHPKVSTT